SGFISACYIQGIFGSSAADASVCVNADGQLGECAAASPFSKNAMLKERQVVQQMTARIALQENQIQTLTAALKQQADQLQKVSAQLEMIRPTPRVVENR